MKIHRQDVPGSEGDDPDDAKAREDAAEQLSQADEVRIRRQLQLNLEQSEAGIEG